MKKNVLNAVTPPEKVASCERMHDRLERIMSDPNSISNWSDVDEMLDALGKLVECFCEDIITECTKTAVLINKYNETLNNCRRSIGIALETGTFDGIRSLGLLIGRFACLRRVIKKWNHKLKICEIQYQDAVAKVYPLLYC